MSKIKKANYSKVLLKYIYSYLILLLVPLLIMSLLLYGYISNIIKEDILSEYKTTLEYTTSVMDSSFQRLINTAVSINNNFKLSKYAISNSKINQMESIDLLNVYSFQNDIISTIGLYYKDIPLIFTNRGNYYPETFKTSKLQRDFGDQAFEEFLTNIDSPAIYSTSSQNTYLNTFEVLYTIPIPVGSSRPKGWVLFVLSENKIKEPIIKMMGKYNSVTLVLDSNNNIVTQIGGQIDTSCINLGLLTTGNTKDKNIVEIKGEKFLYEYASSKREYLSYLTFIQYDTAMSKLNNFKYYFLFGVMAFFALGFLSIIVLGNRHYEPIKGLKDFSMTLLGELTEQRNDFEIIHNSIKTLHERDIAMQSVISNNNRALHVYILKKLLTGNFISRADLNKSADSIKIHFDYDMFRVIILSLEYQLHSTSISNDEVIGFVENHFNSEYNIYGTDTFANNNLIFTLSHYSLDLETLKDNLNDIMSELKRQFNLDFSIGVGGLYNDTTEIPRSYMEALIAVESCFSDRSCPMCYEEINILELESYKEKSLTINKHLFDLERFLRQGDLAAVSISLNRIQTKIVDKHSSILTTRYFCYSIYYAIIQIVSKQGNILSMIAKDYMEALIFCNTVDNYFELLRKLCGEICIGLSAQLESQNLELCNKIIKYIDKYYTNPGFSVQNMAEDLNTSPSYISRYFKDQTGKTITDYVINKRMEKAKDLLRSTDETIRIIIQHIGYENETSFIRTFKKTEGITPGMYRDRILTNT